MHLPRPAQPLQLDFSIDTTVFRETDKLARVIVDLVRGFPRELVCRPSSTFRASRQYWSFAKKLPWPLGRSSTMAPAPGAKGSGVPKDKSANTGGSKVEQSYLGSAVESFNPWAASRSKSPLDKDGEKQTSATTRPKSNSAASRKADDHSLNTLYGQSVRRYPRDCPPLEVMWFHAVDVSVDEDGTIGMS